ncbi:MAG: helix-turn-helix domain-containing protein [Anaerolineaceae bacterium]|nr:MAG: helix-turn-helix domain-containing protein [Anaerolineaceae bacterium]
MNNKNNRVDETTVNVAQQIRMLRERRNLSQRALAEASGLSRNTLSLLERGQTSPTVSTLKRIATALGVDLNAFFNPFEQLNIVHVKSDKRLHLQLSHGSMADLGVGMVDRLVTPLVLQLDPGARSGPPLSHDGQDFIYCLSGEVLYTVNSQAFVLEPGDSLFFDGHLPHGFQSIGPEITKVLIVLSTPRDSAKYVADHFSKGAEPAE